MRGHAGRGVDLQQEGLAVGRANHDVGPRPAAAAQRAIAAQDQILNASFFVGRQFAWADVAGVVAEILVFVVVVAAGGDDADERQRPRLIARADHRAGHFVALDELLHQHPAVEACGFEIGGLHFGLAVGALQTQRGAFMRGLENQRKAQLGRRRASLDERAHLAPLGCGQVLEMPQPLGHGLVDRQGRGQHARPGVGNAEQFQRALHRAVFTPAAMQIDERALRTEGLERRQVVHRRIESKGIDPARLQRGEHALARHQRHLALGGKTAHEHRDPAQTARIDLRPGGHCAVSFAVATT
jgi:hypothetical protein